MNEPWHGDDVNPDRPVTITLPYRTMKRLIRAVTNEVHRAIKRDDEPGVRALSNATEVIGDAIGAPPHRRFRLPDKYYHAVIAGNEREFDRWLRDTPARELPESPLFIDSIETAKANVYSDYTQHGTAYRREDFQEVIAAVRSRTFKKTLERA